MRKRTPMIYKRNKLEISGDPKDVKPHIWIDQLIFIILVIVLFIVLFIIPKASFIPAALIWLKKYMWTLFLGAGDYLLVLFSG